MPCNQKKRKRLWFLMKKQRMRCYYCSRKIYMNSSGNAATSKGSATIDHYIPKALGGTNEIKNCVAACCECNQKKGDLHPVDFFKKHPYAIRDGEREAWESYEPPPAAITTSTKEPQTAAGKRAAAFGNMIWKKPEQS